MSYFNKISLIGLAVGFAFTMVSCDSCKYTSSEKAGKPPVEIPAEPDAAITTILRQFSKQNGGILWQAMPASYQTELTEIIQLVPSKVDDEFYDKIFSIVSQFVGILEDKQEFIFNNQMLMTYPEDVKFQKAWPSFVGMIETLTSSQLGSIEGLRSFNGNEFFGNTVSKMLRYFDDVVVSAELEEFNNGQLTFVNFAKQAVVSVVESDGNRAKLKITIPNRQEIHEFIKVEGKWMPDGLNVNWLAFMANAKDYLAILTPEEMDKKQAELIPILEFFEIQLTQMEEAQTQEQFDGVLSGCISFLPMLLGS